MNVQVSHWLGERIATAHNTILNLNPTHEGATP